MHTNECIHRYSFRHEDTSKTLASGSTILKHCIASLSEYSTQVS